MPFREKDMRHMLVLLVASLALVTQAAEARGREPCSGKKGGISHCSGSKFVCKDGTISKSTKTCSS